MGHLDHLFRGCYRSERIRYLAECYDSRSRAEQLFVFFENHLAAVIYRRHPQPRTFFSAQLLPRDNVRVVLQPGDNDFVILLHVAVSPALGHQVDAFGGAANKNNLARRGSVQEATHFLARTFVGVGGPRGQGVGGAVNIRVLVPVEIRDPVNDRVRFLRGGGIVQPHQRSPVYLLLQDGEIAPDELRIEWAWR